MQFSNCKSGKHGNISLFGTFRTWRYHFPFVERDSLNPHVLGHERSQMIIENFATSLRDNLPPKNTKYACLGSGSSLIYSPFSYLFIA